MHEKRLKNYYNHKNKNITWNILIKARKGCEWNRKINVTFCLFVSEIKLAASQQQMAVRWKGLEKPPGYTFTGLIFSKYTYAHVHTHTHTSGHPSHTYISRQCRINTWIVVFVRVMSSSSDEKESCIRWGGLRTDSAAGRSCCSGQWSNWISCEQLKVMGLWVRSLYRPA